MAKAEKGNNKNKKQAEAEEKAVKSAKKTPREIRNELLENDLDEIQCCFGIEIEHIRECTQNIVSDLLAKEEISKKKMLGIMKKFEEKISQLSESTSLESGNAEDEDEGPEEDTLVPPEFIMELMAELKKVNPKRPSRVIMKSLFLNIFSELDSFLGMLLRYIFKHKPELLEKSEKQYSAQEIFAIGSIEKFMYEVIEKEIDTILRKSYVEQFTTFENKFGIDTLKKFDNWGKFVEISQRRNIIMHCNGRVTNQYLENCKAHKCLGKGLTTNDELAVTLEYLLEAISIVHEVGIKLLHVLWRKQFPGERKVADKALNGYIFTLLTEKNYSLAEVLGEFACKLKNFSDAAAKCLFEINYCIAMKRLGKQDQVSKFIEQRDWSLAMLEFQLAKCILVDDYSNINNLMVKIGNKSEMFTIDSYAQYPIFEFVHDNEVFKNSFQEIFDVEFDTYRAVRTFNEEINPEKVS